jgi:putative flippase GtrA
MDVNEIVTIGVAAVVGVRVAMLLVSKRKIPDSKASIGGTTTDKSSSPSGNDQPETLGQKKGQVWGLSNKTNMTSKMLLRTELIGYVINEVLLVALTSASIYYLYASIAANEAALIVKFFANDLRTFKDRRSGRLSVRLVKFNLLGLFGVGLNLGILYVAATYLHLPYSTGNLIGMAASIPLYFVHMKFTWKKTTQEGAEQKRSPVLEEYR